ncbi:dihydropyrimidinase [Phellopilus nigrolimitatus]|nr:dihydropyrimidinase [Phellopilus nigrolimitatus]
MMSSFLEFDTVVKNGIIVTASDQVPCDIGIKDGVIKVLAHDLPVGPSTTVIDAEGGYVTPGGVDSHVHIAQSGAGKRARSADDWTSATRSAIAGGTTSVIAFAAQSRGTSMNAAVDEYHKLATGAALCDYGFHVIVTDPTEEQMKIELPKLVERGITSVKIYMTYPALRLSDGQILDMLCSARRTGVTTMIHCENSDVIDWMSKSLAERGMTEPWHHGTSRPNIVESEATNRAIALAELMDAPMLIVHVSDPSATRTIRKAQTRLLPIYAETCPQYLLLSGDKMRAPGFEGAMCVCSPPLRDDPRDKERIWDGLRNGTFTVYSSDHAPTNYFDERGKQLGMTLNPKNNPQGDFRTIPNGLPGVETRIPLLWSEGVLKGRISPQRFVELSSTNAAKLYGMYPRKGTIQPGSDADLVIWRPAEARQPYTISNDKLHHSVDYTPYEGLEIADWPRFTILRGKVAYDGGANTVVLSAGEGKFLERGKSTLPGPRNQWLSEWRPDEV